MWTCSVDLLGKIVIFEPGIAFPFQTLARGSLGVKTQKDIQLSLFVALVLGFLLALSQVCPA